MSSFCLVLGVCVLLSLCAVATSIDTPYLLFSTGTTINHVEPDGSNDQVLVTGLSGAFAVDYHDTQNKMFWTSPTNGKVYEAQLDNGNNPTPIVDNVDRPRGLTVDRVNDKLYFSYKSGSNYYVAEKILGGSGYSNILGPQLNKEFTAILVNGGYLYYAVEHEVFKKQLSGGNPVKIYEAASSNVCIFSMAFKGSRLYWAQACSPGNGGIHSVIPSDSNPQQTQKSRPAFQARNGIGIIGTTAYWTGIDKIYAYTCPQGGSHTTVIDVGTTNLQLGGLVVVKP